MIAVVKNDALVDCATTTNFCQGTFVVDNLKMWLP